MLEKDVTVQLELGLHARPSAYISGQLCEMNLASVVFMRKDAEPVDMKSVMSLLAACLVPKETVRVKINGQDEVKAMALIERVFASEKNIPLTLPKK
jgi:catabolite repression HPr-like protein